jgi:hypothetical protein
MGYESDCRNMNMELKPIGRIHSPHQQAQGTPVQPRWATGIEGRVEIFPEYAAGLRDLEGFERIWQVFWCDRANAARMEVVPYRDNKRVVSSPPALPAVPIPLASRAFACWQLMAPCCRWPRWTFWTAHRCWTSNPICRNATRSPWNGLAGAATSAKGAWPIIVSCAPIQMQDPKVIHRTAFAGQAFQPAGSPDFPVRSSPGRAIGEPPASVDTNARPARWLPPSRPAFPLE